MIFPDYNNNIVNISATLQSYLGKDNGIPKIKVLENELAQNYKNVVFIVVDGLGQKILEKHLPKTSFIQQNNRQTVTSVFPSTTTNATTTLMSATYPAEHGWFGWAMNFGDKTIQLFTNLDHYTKEAVVVDFTRKQLPYEYFFTNPTKPIAIYTCMPSQINLKACADNNLFFNNTKDMFKKLNYICKQKDKKFVYCYNPELDSLMHQFGTNSKQANRFVKKFNKRFERIVRKNLNSLFVVTADHGQIDVGGFVDIYKDDEILSCLEKNFSLEVRGAAFHLKEGMEKEFRKAFEKYEADFELFETKELIEKGVFGKFKNEDYKKFLGDFIAIGNENNQVFNFAEDKQKYKDNDDFKGHHTGLTEDEMLVPLIIAGNNK